MTYRRALANSGWADFEVEVVAEAEQAFSKTNRPTCQVVGNPPCGSKCLSITVSGRLTLYVSPFGAAPKASREARRLLVAVFHSLYEKRLV